MKLESYLMERGIGYEKHQHATTYTAQALAAAEHVSGYMVAKPVIVKSASDFVMCVLSAPDHLDLKLLAEVLQDPNVRLATETEMARLFPDCELGAEPPVGALFGMKTIMDARLREDDFLVMQAGTHTESIKMRRDEWERLCEPVVTPIATG